VALARKLVVLAWHMLKDRQPYRYAPIERTRRKLIDVDPTFRRSWGVGLPKDIESVYSRFGLPELLPPSAGEKRVTASNRRAITRLKKQSTV
jgi:hypothetical protein